MPQTNARRSWLVAPAHEPQEAQRRAYAGADVLVLDLEYTVPPRCKERGRSSLKELVAGLSAARCEIFARIDRETRWADAAAAVQRGVSGVVVPGAEESDEVSALAALIAEKERERGIDAGTTEIVLMLESAKGFWNAAELARSSARVSALGVGRIDLTMRLGPVPQGEFRLYRFLMTRTVVAARMLGKQPLGAFWRPGSRGGVAPLQATREAAAEGKRLGFSGCICATPDQVAPANEAYSA